MTRLFWKYRTLFPFITFLLHAWILQRSLVQIGFVDIRYHATNSTSLYSPFPFSKCRWYLVSCGKFHLPFGYNARNGERAPARLLDVDCRALLCFATHASVITNGEFPIAVRKREEWAADVERYRVDGQHVLQKVVLDRIGNSTPRLRIPS